VLNQSSGVWAKGIKVPLPGDAATNPAASLYQVSCPAAGSCTAVGSYVDNAGHAQGLLLNESAGSVTGSLRAPLPADAGANPDESVNAVSCPSVGNCGAVGTYNDQGTNRQGLLLTESSGAWAPALRAPLPADAGTNPGVFLDTVSCPSVGTCGAGGSYFDGLAHGHGLLLNAAPASPGLSVSAPGTGTTGTGIVPAGALSAGAAPSGTITFTVFGPQSSPPSSCSGGTTVGTAAVPGNGTYQPSVAFTPSSAGDYWWYASYGGDTSDNPAASTCGAGMPETVVSRPAGGGAGGGGGPGGGGGSESVQLVGSIRSTSRRVRFKLRCVAPVGQSCRTTDTLTTTETLMRGRPIAVSAAHHPKRRKRAVVVGRKLVTIPAGSTKAIIIPLNAQGRRLLTRFHKLPVTLTVSLIRNGQTTVALKRKLTIKEKKKHSPGGRSRTRTWDLTGPWTGGDTAPPQGL
jgi:hypothetical protein